MGYERLDVTDHVHKWTVAKLRHVEDGILANEEELKNKQPKGDYATNTYVNELVGKIEAKEMIALTEQEVRDICK